MNKFQDKLEGGDLRSIGKANEIASLVSTQEDFDQLFIGLNHTDRKVVMRTADAIEKITAINSEFLYPHKKEILELCFEELNIELKWHLAILLSRLPFTKDEFAQVWQLLTQWARNKKESKIVRVNSVQSLSDLYQDNKDLEPDFNLTIDKLAKENISSLNARIRKLRKAMK